MGIRLSFSHLKMIPFPIAFKRSFQRGVLIFSLLLPGINLVSLYYLIKKKSFSNWDRNHEITLHYKNGTFVRWTLAAILLFSTFHFTQNHRDIQEKTFFSLIPKEHVKDDTSKWKRFTPSSNEFILDFPLQQPTYVYKELPIPKSQDTLPYHEYKTVLNENTVQYSLSHTQLPSRWVRWSSKLVLKGVIKVLVEKQPGTRLVQSTTLGANGYPALDYQLTKNGQHAIGRLILIGQSLYRIEVNFPPSEKPNLQEDINLFIHSFQWVPAQNRAPQEEKPTSPSQPSQTSNDIPQDQQEI